MENQQAFQELHSSLSKDPEELQRFYQDFLKKAGISVFDKPADVPGGIDKSSPAKKAAARAKATAKEFSVIVRWWGITFVMNEQLTNKIATGHVAIGALGSIIAGGLVGAGILAGPIAAMIGAAFAAAFGLKAAEIKIIDNGKGVYWPITWPQWAVIAAAAPSGPAILTAAISAVVHPLPNQA